jgi:hypothetical protein
MSLYRQHGLFVITGKINLLEEFQRYLGKTLRQNTHRGQKNQRGIFPEGLRRRRSLLVSFQLSTGLPCLCPPPNHGPWLGPTADAGSPFWVGEVPYSIGLIPPLVFPSAGVYHSQKASHANSRLPDMGSARTVPLVRSPHHARLVRPPVLVWSSPFRWRKLLKIPR